MSETFETRWIGHDDPIPEGWSLAANEGRAKDHHSHYGRMIVRKVEDDGVWSILDRKPNEKMPGAVE